MNDTELEAFALGALGPSTAPSNRRATLAALAGAVSGLTVDARANDEPYLEGIVAGSLRSDATNAHFGGEFSGAASPVKARTVLAGNGRAAAAHDQSAIAERATDAASYSEGKTPVEQIQAHQVAATHHDLAAIAHTSAGYTYQANVHRAAAAKHRTAAARLAALASKTGDR